MFIFGFDVEKLHHFNFVFKQFLVKKSFKLVKECFDLNSIYKGFNFNGWKFLLVNKGLFWCNVSIQNVKDFKFRLKILVKNVSNSGFPNLVNSINTEICRWINIYGFSDFILNIKLDISFYLYRLLWNLVKKRHPKRPRTWIYNKYFVKVFGKWRFFVFDSSIGKSYFLHFSFFSAKKFYFHPFSLDLFNTFNLMKLNKIFFKKYNVFENSILKLLWKQQLGLCFVCSRSLWPISSLTLKVYFSGKFFGTKLVHNYCFF